jgi:hypothetical protein
MINREICILIKFSNNILVFPAASNPSIRIRISLLPNIFDKIFPMVMGEGKEGTILKKTRK